MTIVLDLDAYWLCVGTITISLASFWGVRRLFPLFNGR